MYPSAVSLTFFFDSGSLVLSIAPLDLSFVNFTMVDTRSNKIFEESSMEPMLDLRHVL